MKKSILVTLFTFTSFFIFAQSGYFDVTAIINFVNKDSLEQTIRELSGEKPVTIQGKTVAIKSRYHLFDDIAIVQQYLRDRLEKYQPDVEVQTFSLEEITDLQFCKTDTAVGWLITNQGYIFGTTDKGRNWQKQFKSAGLKLGAIVTMNAANAIVLAEKGIIKTTDGINWQYVELYQEDQNYYTDVSFINDSVGWICTAKGNLYKTENAGVSWSKVPCISPGFMEIFFLNETQGWAINSDNNKILHTSDGGILWQYQAYDRIFNGLNDILFLNDSMGFMLDSEGKIFKTEDGGETWESSVIDLRSPLKDIQFINDSTGYAIRFGFIYKTTDYGSNWNIVFERGIDDISYDPAGLYVIDTNEIWSYGHHYCSGMAYDLVVRYSSNACETFEDLTGNIPFQTQKNIIATKPGKIYPDDKYVIICAHFDAIASAEDDYLAPGADDNATGVATVIEAARILSAFEFDYPVKFALYDAEETGLHGSEFFAGDYVFNPQKISCVINLDMIGYDGNNDGAMDIYAGELERSQAIGKKAASNVAAYDLDLIPDYSESIEWVYSDHAPFWRHGIPAIHIFQDYDEVSPFYHTPNDILSNMNFDYFFEISKLSIGTLAEIAMQGIPAGVDDNTYTHLSAGEVFPNPACSNVYIPITLPGSMNVDITVFDIAGKRIGTIFSGTLPEGSHTIEWKGLNHDQGKVSSGLYIIKIQTPFEHCSTKVFIR